MRRLLIAAAAALGMLASAGVAPAEEPRVLFRASATSTAIHGFYDHEGLFPVPLLNVSIPYTDATYEPGPTTTALGSFLWNPQAAELGTIVCVLSEGRFCEIPEYPFQARASYPAAGRTEPPPTISIDETGAPLRAAAAHEGAHASERGASSRADVAGFAAVPMSAEQSAAARKLASIAAPLGGGAVEVEPWLIAIGEAASRSRTRSDGKRVVAESTSVLHDVALLGGLVRIEVVRGVAVTRVADSGRARAESVASGITVADVSARVTPDGISIADRDIPSDAAETLQAALDSALDGAGVHLVAGRDRVRRTKDAARAEAFALSLEFAARTLPEELPEGTQGRDVVRVPLGYAAAEAAVAQIVVDPPPPPPTDHVGPEGPVGTIGSGTGAIGGTGGVSPPPAPIALPSAAPAANASPSFALSDLGIPRAATIAVLAAALLLAVALTWLRVTEVLHEEALSE